MGQSISAIISRLLPKRHIRIIMVGLTGAGKTNILFKFKVGQIFTTIPTIGFSVDTVVYKNVVINVWDIDKTEFRSYWEFYYQDTLGIIFLVDSNDPAKLHEARDELMNMLKHTELKDAALCVLANKQDLPNAMGTADIATKLGLYELGDRKWSIGATCASTGSGIYEALDWLSTALSVKK